jgi:hypothetical protein
MIMEIILYNKLPNKIMEVGKMGKLKELRSCIFYSVHKYMPATVAERSKKCTVFDRSEARIVGSNPT